MFYAEPIYRPPSERESLLIQVTIGCSRPICTFCFVSQQRKAFRVRPLADIKADIDEAASIMRKTVLSVFLLAGDPSVMKADFLCEVCTHAYKQFPNLKSVSMYAHARDFLNKSGEDLTIMRESGIKKVFVGVESGSDAVLRYVKKGVNAEEMVEGCRKALNHGFTLSTQIILGLGGKRLSRDHAIQTGRIISDISPHFVAALSLLIYPNTELGAEVRSGSFQELESSELLEELQLLLESMDSNKFERPCVFRTNHPSNYLETGGTLPDDLPKLVSFVRAERVDPQNIKAEIGRVL
jgi:radical SAM superfamily enzyme YgiQ (UPF0313 family)